MRIVASLFLGALFLSVGCLVAPPENDQASANEVTGSVCTPESTCASIAVRPERAACSLVVVFDGSGVYSPDVDSNVGRIFKEARGPAARSGPRGLNGEVVDASTTRVYIEGVPALPFGASAERVERGRSAICQHLRARANDACAIVLLGYSRGAFIANQIAHALNDHGCADGSHKGQRIAFLGAFDPVNKQMGSEWEDERTGTEHHWEGVVPSNVDTVLQVYKDPFEDPRGGFEGYALTTTLMSAGSASSSCNAPMTSRNHPTGAQWHHGEVGHGTLPMETMKCALERSGIQLF